MLNVASKTEELRTKLQNILTREYEELGIKSLEVAGSGVQNVVLRGDSETGSFAFRVPWEREVANINENLFSSRLSLQKEAKLSAFCHSQGIPVPAVHGLHLSEELDFLISDYIVTDATPISSYEIGELANKLHHMPIECLHYENEHGKSTEQHIAERLARRLQSFNKITSLRIPFPKAEEIEAILKEGEQVTRLLHMDIRPANIIGHGGEIQAIVDWDNALIGHPLLELMRIAEVNEVNWSEFKAGYKDEHIFESLPKIVCLFYRLDTALMLANLFIAQLKIKDKGLYYRERVEVISNEIHTFL
ncbi:phosphotransferase [Bacillus cereus]|uniref:phosphotransferase family protein n=1 Tax=Bacillus TaxID=1386 RepID=UPI000552EC94|nr:phosphotransferase [Bacillus sp. UNC322MFChir4.1]